MTSLFDLCVSSVMCALYFSTAYKCRCTRKGPKIRYKDVQKLEIKPKHPFCQEKMILWVTLWFSFSVSLSTCHFCIFSFLSLLFSSVLIPTLHSSFCLIPWHFPTCLPVFPVFPLSSGFSSPFSSSEYSAHDLNTNHTISRLPAYLKPFLQHTVNIFSSRARVSRTPFRRCLKHSERFTAW